MTIVVALGVLERTMPEDNATTKDKNSSYYGAGGIESIDFIKAKLTEEQYKGFLLGNILKYSSRCNYKGVFDRDVEKIGVYQKLLEEL